MVRFFTKAETVIGVDPIVQSNRPVTSVYLGRYVSGVRVVPRLVNHCPDWD